MRVESVLVAGGGIAGCAAAIALARRGVDVALVERGPRWPDVDAGADESRDLAVLDSLGVVTGSTGGTESAQEDVDRAVGIGRALRESFTALRVEVRIGVGLIGVIEVDSHVEAELSNGRIENFDAVVVADGLTAVSVGIGERGAWGRVAAVKAPADALKVAERLAGEEPIIAR